MQKNDPTNSEIAALLEELGDLYELEGASFHRVLAYRNAAHEIKQLPEPAADLVRAKSITSIPGIGKTLDEKLTSLIETGEIPALTRLRSEIPAGLVQITHIEGIGAKKARKLYDLLKIDSPAALREALESQKVRELKGFGAKSEQQMLDALNRASSQSADGTIKAAERVLLAEALQVGEPLLDELRAHAEAAGANTIELAGSARRLADSVHDLDIIAGAEKPEVLVEAFSNSPLIGRVTKSGEAGASGVTQSGLGVDLRIVSPDRIGSLLQHFSGSKTHNVILRSRAAASGLHVSEQGILDDATGVTETFSTEAGVYERLGYPWIAPEMREGRGELDLEQMPRLVEESDIKGDLHMHTTESDGRASAREMVQAAIERGLQYIALTDHSASHGFGNDVTPQRLAELVDEVHQLDAEFDEITVLIGSEVNIGVDGDLDYPDELLQQLDWVVASVHTSFAGSQTERLIAACEHPFVDVIGHPTGRLIEKRQPYEVDMGRLIASAAETGTMLEINSSPRRRDLNEIHAKAAAAAGVKLCINTDSHGPESLTNLRWGIATARRAWLGPEQIANTLSWAGLKQIRKGAR